MAMTTIDYVICGGLLYVIIGISGLVLTDDAELIDIFLWPLIFVKALIKRIVHIFKAW